MGGEEGRQRLGASGPRRSEPHSLSLSPSGSLGGATGALGFLPAKIPPLCTSLRMRILQLGSPDDAVLIN